jgi:hypothetical protein
MYDNHIHIYIYIYIPILIDELLEGSDTEDGLFCIAGVKVGLFRI